MAEVVRWLRCHLLILGLCLFGLVIHPAPPILSTTSHCLECSILRGVKWASNTGKKQALKGSELRVYY